jgi:hypothetical protein
MSLPVTCLTRLSPFDPLTVTVGVAVALADADVDEVSLGEAVGVGLPPAVEPVSLPQAAAPTTNKMPTTNTYHLWWRIVSPYVKDSKSSQPHKQKSL